MTINGPTWVLLGTVALILAGFTWVLFVKRFIKRKPAKLWRYFRKPRQRARECQSCQQFISCAMAGVDECPLLNGGIGSYSSTGR